MDFKQIQELIKILGKSDLIEIKIQQDNFKITLKKAGSPVAYTEPPRPVQGEPAVQPSIQPQADIPPAPSGNAKPNNQAAANGKFITIKSPMVGTFYRSSSPDKEPLVKTGDLIKKGDHICIIEAMKLFNEIESELEGKVVKVLVDNATPVEYDQPLFLIDPS